MDEPLSIANLQCLLGQVLTRYGSVEAFCAQLHQLLDAPTLELPALTGHHEHTGRHRRRDTATGLPSFVDARP
ncbi:hypothetical protein [Nocardia tengchongensis]|uniref:hypothetical protein n=1 Tax=Nocardia tengchongensis TaxID=2055889 RepID=UPI00360F7C5D